MSGFKKLRRGLARLPRPSATARIAIGVLSLTVSLVLTFDLIFNVFPSEAAQVKSVRERSAVDLAIQVKVLLSAPGSQQLLQTTLSEVTEAATEILSIGVRRADGTLAAASPTHETEWEAPAGGRSTLTNIIVPLHEAKGPWGQVEIHYKPLYESGWRAWLKMPVVILLLGLCSIGFLVYFLYLKRVLQHLDPSNAIPERVRTAFNTLTEGLLVLDTDGRILLANDAFVRLCPSEDQRLLGRLISEVKWLSDAMVARSASPPWVEALSLPNPILGLRVEIARQDDTPLHALLNCAAIRDAFGNVRGCLLTLDDVTELDRVHSKLKQAMSELETSRDQIQRQNEELQLLAHFDAMTGCMNRRAFFAKADEVWAKAKAAGQPLACLMSDIDKFKTFNDTYGHTVGDQVIQEVAKVLRRAMRPTDLLCRYGGEEFCILLPGTTKHEALRIAEHIRASIEHDAGKAVTTVPNLRITSSFGVALLTESGAENINRLIEAADLGLYAAKESGRNRVCSIGRLPRHEDGPVVIGGNLPNKSSSATAKI